MKKMSDMAPVERKLKPETKESAPLLASLDERSRVMLKTLATICLSIFTLVAFVLLFQRQTCSLDDAKPGTFFQEIRNIPSNDFRALASLRGYIKYLPDKSRNRPRVTYLKLHHTSTKISAGGDEIVLEAGCATIYIGLATRPLNVHVTSLRVRLSEPNLGAKECIGFARWIFYRPGHHFSCSKEYHFMCYAHQTANWFIPIASVHIEALEFEIGDDKRFAMSREFSTHSDGC